MTAAHMSLVPTWRHSLVTLATDTDTIATICSDTSTWELLTLDRAANDHSEVSIFNFQFTEKVPTRAISWLKDTIKHYAKQALTHGK